MASTIAGSEPASRRASRVLSVSRMRIVIIGEYGSGLGVVGARREAWSRDWRTTRVMKTCRVWSITIVVERQSECSERCSAILPSGIGVLQGC